MKLVVKAVLVALALASVGVMAALQFQPIAAPAPPPAALGNSRIRAKAGASAGRAHYESLKMQAFSLLKITKTASFFTVGCAQFLFFRRFHSAPALGASEIVIATAARTAGAIQSLTWDGVEFVDSFDHGREIQSAANFDSGQEFIPEVFNPTEAGSMADGANATSTSQLLELSAKDNQLMTLNRMAFWLAPGEKSQGHPARNTTALSDHYLVKRIAIGYKDLPHAIEYRVTFLVPNEKHTYAQFEAATGYMPLAFGKFLRFDAKQGKLLPLTDGPGEQADPVVFSTDDGKRAMGVYSPDQPSKGFEQAGYGRFRFKAEKVLKWNCVFRVKNPAGVPGGAYQFRNFLVVGTVADCEATLAALHKEFAKP